VAQDAARTAHATTVAQSGVRTPGVYTPCSDFRRVCVVLLLPQSWHRQITIGRFSGDPTQPTTREVPDGGRPRPSEFTLRAISARRLASHAPYRREICLFGQLTWPRRCSDDRSGSKILRQQWYDSGRIDQRPSSGRGRTSLRCRHDHFGTGGRGPADIRDAVKELLEGEGYVVHCAVDADEAIDLLALLPRPCLFFGMR